MHLEASAFCKIRCTAHNAFLREVSKEIFMYTPEYLAEKFIELYGGNRNDVKLYSSPARINIIGEHIDYNGGFVLPCAIDRYLYIAIRKRNDSSIIYNDIDFPGEFRFSTDMDFEYKKENGYANFLNGILFELKKKHRLENGFEILMASNVSSAGGISSSSALECGFAYAVSETFGLNLSRTEIAKLGQMSEHNFMNVKCGIMDQFIISTAKKDTAELLDCNTLEYSYLPLNLGECEFVVMNTNKQRKLCDSKYNERRSQCEKALGMLNEKGINIKNLCDLTAAEFGQCMEFITDDILKDRAFHCVHENERVKKAAEALGKGDLEKLGKLLYESHESLRDKYEVTGIELDTLAEAAISFDGCIGARMTGAGFGGCAIAIVRKDCAKSFTKRVGEIYREKIGYEASFFECKSGDGVMEIKNA